MTTKRPKPPWAPIPLSEIAIAVGVGLLLTMFLSKGEVGIGFTVAGLFLTSFGAIEVIWREHRAGYRSHAALLAAVVVFPIFFALGTIINHYKQVFFVCAFILWVLLWLKLKRTFGRM